MPLLVLGLVLASAVVHATWNLWTKQLGPAVRQASLLWLLTAISSVCYAPFAVATMAHTHWSPTPSALALILGSAWIHVGYFFLLLRGYRAGDLSLVYPLARGTGPLLATAGAVALFGEHPTWLSVTGALLVVTGVAVMTAPAVRGVRGHAAAAVGYGLATGVSIAIYTLWDGWGVKRAGVPPLVFYWAGEVVRVLTLTPLAMGLLGWDTSRFTFLSLSASFFVLAVFKGAASSRLFGLVAALLLAFALFGHFIYFDDYQPRPLLPYPNLAGFVTSDLPAEIRKLPRQ